MILGAWSISNEILHGRKKRVHVFSVKNRRNSTTPTGTAIETVGNPTRAKLGENWNESLDNGGRDVGFLFLFFVCFNIFVLVGGAGAGVSEFDRYHVSVGTGRPPPIIVGRDEPRIAVFNEGLEPGRTYPVLVKTLSGNVASWPATANITTRPLAVLNLTAAVPGPGTEGITSVTDLLLSWSPDPRSQQDAYKIVYQVRPTENYWPPNGNCETRRDPMQS